MPRRSKQLVVRNARGNTVDVTKAGLAMIEELASKNRAEATIAKVLGMSPSTFRVKKKDRPEIVEALELGRAAHHDFIMGKLDKLVEEENVSAIIYSSKAVHGYRDQGPPTAEDHRAQINIQIVAPMSKEEADELVIDHNPTD